jgi:hypothetical protein
MTSYRYTPEFSCIYVDRALEVNPGDVVEWDEMPNDGRWEPVDSETPGGGDNFPDEQARAELAETQQPVDEQPPAEQQAKKTTRRAAQNTEE